MGKEEERGRRAGRRSAIRPSAGCARERPGAAATMALVPIEARTGRGEEERQGAPSSLAGLFFRALPRSSVWLRRSGRVYL
jgi:hypothetical protein